MSDWEKDEAPYQLADALDIIAAKDREIAALREAINRIGSYTSANVRELDEALWNLGNANKIAIASISSSPAPDPAEAMRAQSLEAVDRWSGRIDASLKGKGEGR